MVTLCNFGSGACWCLSCICEGGNAQIKFPFSYRVKRNIFVSWGMVYDGTDGKRSGINMDWTDDVSLSPVFGDCDRNRVDLPA